MTTTNRAFEIQAAIPHGVVPFYQPIANTSTPFEMCYEVLGRLQVKGEILAPGQFLPSIEQTPHMATFDQAILVQAIEQMGHWIHQNDREVHLHVNASAQSLARPGYVTLVQELLQANRVNPHYLTIEVVETCTFWQSRATLRTLAGLRQLGVKVAIDDFPCWENPDALLNWLVANPSCVQTLKLDRSLVVAACGYDLRGASIPQAEASAKLNLLLSYVRFAKELGLEVVAEGVETEEQVITMQRCGINQLQGYGIGRPQPASQLTLSTENFEGFVPRRTDARQLCTA